MPAAAAAMGKHHHSVSLFRNVQSRWEPDILHGNFYFRFHNPAELFVVIHTTPRQ
jgi:hypothetical protein